MSTTFKNGDEVRIKNTYNVVTLEDVNTNPDFEADGEVWAEAITSYGDSTYIDSPKDVELVRRFEDVPAKTLPTLIELADSFSGSLHSAWSDIVIDETDPTGEPDGQFLAYGKSATGARFGCRVTISEVEWMDY